MIVFGAHPDDCEYDSGGTAALWARQGHKVKFVALTNGDIGHHEIGGAMLARRRSEEARRAAAILGVETEVVDNYDSELLPTLTAESRDHSQRRAGAPLRQGLATLPLLGS
jgi:LmbE family N-acetylglucosaminyl deacetylase